jgi:hypothetical protein
MHHFSFTSDDALPTPCARRSKTSAARARFPTLKAPCTISANPQICPTTGSNSSSRTLGSMRFAPPASPKPRNETLAATAFMTSILVQCLSSEPSEVCELVWAVQTLRETWIAETAVTQSLRQPCTNGIRITPSSPHRPSSPAADPASWAAAGDRRWCARCSAPPRPAPAARASPPYHLSWKVVH